MAESNATQVILTDDGLKIIKAQSTADSAAGGVTNLNDPNLMSVIEKQTQAAQYAGLTSQYNVILERAKDAGISTTALTTAYTNLNAFMTTILTDTTKASDVNRSTYKSLTDAYNTAISNVQTALNNSFNTDISNMQSSVSVASQAASNAVIVASQAALTGDNAGQLASHASWVASQAQSAGDNAVSVANNASQAASSAILVGSTATVNADKAISVASQAQIAGNNATSVANNAVSVANNASQVASSATSSALLVGSQASSEIAVQSTATAKAQSTADSAFSQAQAVGSQTSADIVVQSTATAKAQSTADSAFSQATTAIDNGQAVSQAVTALKDGSTLTIAELGNGLATKVANSDYASYQTQTASQIASKVDNGAFSAYQTQTANLIAQKVATSDFSAYQATTAKAISSKVESSDFNTYKTQTANLIDDKVSSSEYASDKTQTASQISQMVSNSAFSAYQTQTASQIAQTVSNSAFSAYQQTTASLISSKVATSDFNTYVSQTATAISSKVDNGDFNTYKTQTADTLQTLVSRSPSNIIKDGGFNSAVVGQTPSGWDWSSNGQIVANPDTVSNLVATGHPVLQINSRTSGNSDIYYGAWFDVQPGDQFYTEFKARWSAMSQKGQIVFGMVTKDASGNLNWTSAVTVSSPGTWAKYTGVLTIPAGAVQGRVWLSWQGSAAANQAVQVTDLVVRPAYSTQSDITQSINNIQLGFKNPDGSNFQMNLSSNGVALLDFSKIMLNGSTNITNGTIGTAQIADAAITNAKIASLAVGTAQIANGAITTAQIGSAAVGTAQIANLAVGTAQIGNAAITSAKIANLAVGTAQIANAAITDAQVGNISANHLNAGTIDFNTITGKNINASNITTGKLNTNLLNVGQLSALSADLGNVTAGSLKGVDIVADTFSTPNGSFTTDASGAVVASNLTIRGVTNLVYNAALLGGNGSSIPGWTISNNGCYWPGNVHDGVPSIGWHNTATGWTLFAQSKLVPLNGTTGIPFSASVWFSDFGSDTSLKYQLTLAFFDSNGNRIYGGPVDNAWNGVSSGQGWSYKTINNAVAPSNAASVALQYWAYNGKGNAEFSSPMLTQSAQATGYQPDTGNVVSAGEIDGSVINGSTINGTTFNAGTRLNSYGNTSYPLTINQDGSVTSTSFGNIANYPAALRTVMKDGTVKTNFRGMNQISTGIYSAADVALGAGQLALFEGYTTSQDPNFTATGIKPTGYVILDAGTGLNLHGDNQQITFNGTSDDVTPKGIIITPYGNINPNGTQNIWYIGNGPSMKTASFGMDSSGANNIQFNRSLDIGNFNINTYHTITSSDNGPIHFNRNDGSSVDIFAATVNYTSLVKSSLLSVKKDVKKADTAYWAQLVNSIDLATYQYKSDDNTSHIRLSSIVDDVNDTKQWRLPDIFISRDEDGKLNGVDDSVLLNATLATVQEQQKEIDQLNGHNMELEARLNKLEAKLNG